jgi:Protein of unknown function (DUF3455)
VRKIAHYAAAGLLLAGGALKARAADGLVPPPGDVTLLLELAADGVQIYACEMKDGRADWAFKRPEAMLFDRDGRQVGTHFGGPTWKLDDGSAVIGEVVSRADAPEAGAIPWLLLRAKSHDGSGALSRVTYIRRAETKGGAAPQSGCDASRAVAPARMRYSAIYQFFAAGK